MAFSLGFISYTISKVIDAFEDLADDVMMAEPGTQKGAKGVPDAVASEVFAQVTESTENNLKSPLPGEKEEHGIPASEILDSIDTLPVTVGNFIVETEVTEYFLRYAYDIDDVPNTRLRFDSRQNMASIFEKKLDNRAVVKREDARKKRDSKNEILRDDERQRDITSELVFTQDSGKMRIRNGAR